MILQVSQPPIAPWSLATAPTLISIFSALEEISSSVWPSTFQLILG
eukprot:COSAG04_NODE_217_length_19889_cov_59.963221_10_plen_46_part_00